LQFKPFLKSLSRTLEGCPCRPQRPGRCKAGPEGRTARRSDLPCTFRSRARPDVLAV